MRDGFPLITTKKINPQTIFVELEGFIKGITDKRWYQERKCYIWDEWCNPQRIKDYFIADPYIAFTQVIKKHFDNPSISTKFINQLNKLIDEQYYYERVQHIKWTPNTKTIYDLIQLYECDLGEIYGKQWRSFGNDEGIDQLYDLVNTMKNNPLDRRMIVSAWNPTAIKANTMALPPCHWAFEVHSNGTEFDLIWHQRSVDVFLGLPFNIASYAMLMKLLEKETGLVARHLNGFLGNTHIYENHMEQINLQLSREPYALPTLKLPDDVNIFNWESHQWELINYQHHPFIKAPVAV
jgi:thymidylate synthase